MFVVFVFSGGERERLADRRGGDVREWGVVIEGFGSRNEADAERSSIAFLTYFTSSGLDQASSMSFLLSIRSTASQYPRSSHSKLDRRLSCHHPPYHWSL